MHLALPPCRIALFLLACTVGVAFAQPHGQTPAMYLEGGRGSESTGITTLGATLPWKGWSRALWGGQLSGHWDVALSRWSYDAPAGQDGQLTALALVPVLRWQVSQGHVPWFVQAGVGGWLGNRLYHTTGRRFGSRLNFASHLGLGVRLGAQQQHEWLLRVQHVSNAGIKKPNPGKNLVHLRYALHF